MPPGSHSADCRLFSGSVNKLIASSLSDSFVVGFVIDSTCRVNKYQCPLLLLPLSVFQRNIFNDNLAFHPNFKSQGPRFDSH